MKKLLIYSAVIMSLTLFSCSSTSSSTNSNTKKSSSTEIKITSPTVENDINTQNSTKKTGITVSGGFSKSLPIIRLGNNTYVSQWKDNNRLYKYISNDLTSLNDLTKADKKYDYYCTELIQDNERIYFSNMSDNNSIYTLTDSTGEIKKFDNSRSSNLVLGSDGLYFINASDNNKIYKISLADKIKTAVTQDSASKFLLFNDWIIYQNKNDKYRIYAYSLADKTKLKLTNNSSESFGVTNNNLYYVNSGEGDSIWSLDLQTLEEKKIVTAQAENLQIVANRIFFINKSDSSYLYELISPSTGNQVAATKSLVTEGINQYHILENTIYYESITSHNDIKAYNIK
ncbi:DUF5050 domain-containing protein [Clostridium manihotivorum]|uniref:Prolow-density lipoprotein receptor-related protein 1-like beta-propeller domain-containing protein n=1 Tax=Clostridium manihotivorum TaxID=2320868 RepID=A0A3R5QRI2_9CLOT|nr:DUF5050 domain-containing protein [Clostridium manihotivorum]QAA30757.1 hypothetical protein C1I91_03240 [Clostridium manihotivorum]